MNSLTCGFIGLGLIGGSIARALREKIPNVKIIVYDTNPETLEAALGDKVADRAARAIDESFSHCDYLFLCAPVQKNDSNLKAVKKILSPSCLLTDVGSVKSQIHHAVEAAGLSSQFIGGHPMTGSERTGYVNSKALLLENAYFILTPTDKVSSRKVEAYRNLALKLGAIPLVMDCRLHDYVTAAISHLPHVIASSLVNLIQEQDSSEGIMRLIAAGGFKDITRIASSSPVMWQQICLTNTENIAGLLSAYIDSLSRIKDSLLEKDETALYEFFDRARLYRDSFIDASSGPIKRSYTLDLDIADEPGALAAIATILALNQISIKNIGIVHNREFEGGVLKIEFYAETSIKKASRILCAKGYLVHKTD